MLDPGDYDGTYEAEAGALCLDFANTVSARGTEHPHEWLNSYTNLLAWGRLTNVLSPETAKALRAKAADEPEDQQAVMKRAIRLREAIYSLLIAKETPYPGRDPDLETLNQELQIAWDHLDLAAGSSGFHWEWPRNPDRLDAMLWPVAKSAVDLLLSPEIQRVGACAADDCGWFFLDHSKNHSRRWCDMNSCGNRDKARKHYQRKKKTQADPTNA